jgi:serine/threonine protein phosphatase PrpC
MSVITPLEPGAPRRHRGAGRQAIHTTLFGRVDAAAASSRGSLHRVNEDAHSTLGRHGRIFVVADGVGGGAMAAMASRELVTQLHAALDGHRIGVEAVREAVLAADRAIAESIAELTDFPGAATVALCAPVNAFASKWLVCWVGDCRVYRVAGHAPRSLQALTVDDTFEHLAETPPPGSSPEDPARMVGNGAVSRPNVAFTELERGDMLVLCSDGVHKHVAAEDFERLPDSMLPLAERCDALIALARANGSTDDATVLLVQRAGMGLWMSPRSDDDGVSS